MLVTAYQARDGWGIPYSRIPRWKHHERADVHGYAGKSPLFDLGQLMDLNEQANAHPRAKL